MKYQINPLLLESNIANFRDYVIGLAKNAKNKDLIRVNNKLLALKDKISKSAINQMVDKTGTKIVQNRLLPKSQIVADRLIAKSDAIDDALKIIKNKKILAVKGIINQQHAFDVVDKYGINNPLLKFRK